MLSILVVEDETLLRELLVRSISTTDDFTCADSTDAAAKALSLCSTHQPDLVLMDIKTADGDGIDAARAIKLAHPHIKVLMLTASSSEALIARALEAGADGYALKSVAVQELMEIIRHTVKGFRVITVPSGPNQAARTAYQFTPLEITILTLLSEGRTAREVAEELHFSHGTIRNYISSMISRMGFKDRVQLVAYSLHEGIIRM